MCTKRSGLAVALLLAVGALTQAGIAQVATGMQPFGSFSGGPFDSLNVGNLDVHWAVPIVRKAGRGIPFNYDLTYDSVIYQPATSSGVTSWVPVGNVGGIASYWGWQGLGPTFSPHLSYNMVYTSGQCGMGGVDSFQQWTYSNFVYYDTVGASHVFPVGGVFVANSTCPVGQGPQNGEQPPGGYNVPALDGSGYNLIASFGVNGAGGSLNTPSGTALNVPWFTGPPSSSPYSETDANGNEITYNANTGVYTDTLGTSVLTAAGQQPSPVTFTYTSPVGSEKYTVNFSSYNVKTNFACSAVSEYSANSVSLVSSIALPDGSSYSFSYEPTPNNSGYTTGRVSEITLPTGGSISYNYTYSGSHDGINCSDGSTMVLERTVNPGGVWQYTRSGSSPAWTTLVTDPHSNQTSINFEQYNAQVYETQRLSYSGSTTSGTLLETDITCYNGQSVGTPANCYNTAVTAQVTRITTFRYLPNAAGQRSETDSTYDNFGLIHEVDEYDYGTGAVGGVIRKTYTTYTSGLSNGIVDRPSNVTIKDSGGTVRASTSYNYDEQTPTQTTGTPQHVTVSGSHGLLTSVIAEASGSINLYRKYTYYDTGNLSTSTDVSTSRTTNGASTTYTYGTGSCGNSFVTSIAEPLSLSRSMTWDCNGGVMLSLKDENLNTSSTAYSGTNYSNVFWRPYNTTDQAGTITDYSYILNSSNQPFQTESKYDSAFNSGQSTVDILTTFDGFGRTSFSQTKQSPTSSNYDTTATCYDNMGRVSFVSLPYSATAITSGTACPSGSGTSYAYDALSRQYTVSDSGGGQTTYSYNFNDVLQTLTTPTQAKQLQYDALGRLSSVCEVTSGTTAFPGASCGQHNSETGYLTSYTYDVLGDLTGVTQNAQASSGNRQTRSYAYDMLGRLTQETNPEMNNGTVAYSYDKLTSDASCGSPNFAGDLVKRVDAASNASCYSGYDALHRVGTITYPSTSTPVKNFVYDAASVNGTSMTNAKTKLARAYTCTGTCTSNITDLFFSYSVTGQTTDVWELTPHSGTNTYYHVTSLPWPNGTMNVLKNLSGLPTITYSADGEGRLGTVTAGSGQNPVTSVSYDPMSHVTALTYGSSDSDAFTFYGTTGRMHTYQFTVGSTPKTNTGTLAWNANGTLQQLAITDNVNSSNSQTCNYTPDDLGRVASSNCGTSIWNQNFSYDPFGNIVKTVPTGSTGTSFNVNYDYTNNTNRITTTPYSYTSTSDPNAKTGNMTADDHHNYAWDTDGHVVAIDSGSSSGVCLTYDAMGRAVEKDTGASCSTSPTSSTEIVYGPAGNKLALMNGSSLVKAFVPLPGGAEAVYNSSGLQYYRHPDWLGSSRMATTTSRTSYYDVAYAPFGEPYLGTGTQDLSFTGQSQDTESSTVPGGAGGLYDFLYREHSPVQGRWLSPDPAGLTAVTPADPQTWNRYAYVRNSPLTSTDADGRIIINCDPDDPFCPGPIPLPPCDPDGGCFCDPVIGCGCDPSDPVCDPGGGPGGGGGGGGGGTNPGTGGHQRTGGVWPGNETTGLPNGLNTSPLSSLDGVLGLMPGINCGGGGLSGSGFGFTAPTSNNPCPFPPILISDIAVAPLATDNSQQQNPNSPDYIVFNCFSLIPQVRSFGGCTYACEGVTIPDGEPAVGLAHFSARTLAPYCLPGIMCPRRLILETNEGLNISGGHILACVP
jgi:RHS repeat-associated protein